MTKSAQPTQTTAVASSLAESLKHHFGFDSFRPLQQEIIQDVLDGRDVFALLPTGGGKSLCFQLPALINDGLTLVVSPLIALMKDQVDALQANGLAATFLNSTLSPEESAERMRALDRGEIRLLYAAPERLMLPDFLLQLQRWNVRRFAIDEAHCISEWGHDFRPEYRKLAELRRLFPDAAMIAVTATATERVREDIVQQLGLRDAKCYVASFNRPNLTYTVLPKQKPYQQLRDFLKTHENDSGIVYCHSRATAEEVAAQLAHDGIKAKPYHAGLEPKTRSRHQDLFLRDDVQVICATIAFGMGINKSNVRFVVHYDLPKNVEGYYQETGRAGRDGLPSDCLLLFSTSDVQKQSRFIGEKSDPQEQAIARRQLNDMVHFAETNECRREFLLRYFGETFTAPCNACDSCLQPRARFDGTVPAQKFLSCIYRIQQKSGLSVGLNHVVDVLRGSRTEKISNWNHQDLSTYGIGKDISKRDWLAIGRELLRLRLVAQRDGFIPSLSLTAEGLAALTDRRPIELTRLPETVAHEEPRSSKSDPLFDHLRTVRRRLADEQNVPAYIVFSDDALRDMTRKKPMTLAEFARVRGVGDKKLKAFGETFVAAIKEFVAKIDA